ncbi:Solute carrier family 25 member 51 [Bagarius yarrelli]|uniref:Solute carrier family 25 member 51 n=1 Tax=Bagarius yarrelli TaxID=175774 RepID=A0A556VAW3_BAGYA|nr:Solute carrier family 25 member 51 [Bagarius yarrelli]
MGVVTSMDQDSSLQPQTLPPPPGGSGSPVQARRLEMGLEPRGKHYVCGSVAAFTNIMITFPIQKVLFRQQLHGLRALEAVGQLQKEGLRTLYRGLLPPLLQKTVTVALMFGLYDDFSRLLLHHGGSCGAPEILTRSTAAFMAGTAEAVLTPFERVQTLLQDHRHAGRFRNTAHAFSTLLQQYGVRECYRGLIPVLLRNGPSNMLFFGLRGPLRERLPDTHTRAGHMLNDFVCGGLLGAALGVLFYPLNVAKSRAQAQVGGAFVPINQVLRTVWIERGRSVARLFRGATLNYHRSLLSWGIINATYELLLKII